MCGYFGCGGVGCGVGLLVVCEQLCASAGTGRLCSVYLLEQNKGGKSQDCVKPVSFVSSSGCVFSFGCGDYLKLTFISRYWSVFRGSGSKSGC